MFAQVLDWLDSASIPAIGALVLACMLAASFVGHLARVHGPAVKGDDKDHSHESYVVSAVLGLLALLTSFTFALAVDRFETRRVLVLEQANAIGTAYLRIQLLPQPHRGRLSELIVRYVDNAIVVAKVGPAKSAPFMARDDELITEIWAATAAAYDSVKQLPFSVAFISAVNSMIDMDGARRAARHAHVPTEIFAVLFLYLVVTAGVLGYVLSVPRGQMVGTLLLLLLTFSLLLIIDIDRPTSGGILESQGPMEDLRKSFAGQPPQAFERWRGDHP